MAADENSGRATREVGYRAQGLWTDDRIGWLLAAGAQRWPDRELFCFESRRVTYQAFHSWVNAVAAQLVQSGVCRGDRVMVQLPNCLEALVLQMAAFRIGAVNMPVIPIYREREMRQILADARPTVVAVAAELGSRRPVEEIDALCGELGLEPVLRYVVGAQRNGWQLVPALEAELGPIVELPEPLVADEPALLLYTSGTTSAPKGVWLTSQALLAHLRNFQRALGGDETTVLLAGTPLSHLGGFVAGVVYPAFLGARSVILRSWRPDDAVALIEGERVTLMMGATVFLTDLLDRYESQPRAGHRLSQYACAGATIPPAVIERADAIGVAATRVYGMTETAGVCTAAKTDDPLWRRSRWDGRVLRGMEIEAVDEYRRTLPPGAVGELRIRGPQLLTGYTDPELTRTQIDQSGWFYPGDVGMVDEYGWVRMTGRSKDIINRGGEKFSTADIEAAIGSHPAVRGVAVTSVPDARFGEAVGAWLVMEPGFIWDGPDALIAHLEQGGIAKQKIPVHWRVVDSIPISATGKVQKHQLSEL